MGLVDYASSDSESEAPPQPPPAPTSSKAPSSKKPFQKVVDRSNPGKIVVNLPTTSNEDEPPAKRARTDGASSSSGGRFSGFNSFLPAPKKTNTAAVAASTSSKPRPGVNLKTGATPGFSRDEGYTDGRAADTTSAGDFSLPPPKQQAEPSIPEGQKPAEEVKLVGKPMMFRPLSVSRNNNKKKTTKPKPTGGVHAPTAAAPTAAAPAMQNGPKVEAAPAPKKKSLFSMHVDEPPETPDQHQNGDGSYQPLLHGTDIYANAANGEYDHAAPDGLSAAPGSTITAAPPHTDSLDSIANDLNLSASARRELFGRDGGGAKTAKNVINFNMDQEYKHNEEIRAAGEQQIHNPVRSIQAAGKNSLQKLVQNVQNQREALEDSFAKGKSNRREAANRYGW
jgi:hypothetical protein